MSQNVKVYRTLEFYAQGGATRMSTIDTDESATILYWKPETDDTGYLAIGDGTKDMDVKIFLGTAAVYALFDVGNSRFSLVGVDMATDAAVSITDSTESTSTTTGALVVTGGIGFGKDMYVGDDVFLTSAAKLDWNAGDVTLTHGANVLTVAGGLLTSTNTTGFSSTATFVPDSTRTNYAFAVGTRATELDITTAGAASQHFDPIQINLNIIGTIPTSTSTMNAIYMQLTHDTTAMTGYLRLKGCDWTATIAQNLQDVYIFQGEVDFTAATTVGGEAAGFGITMSTASASAVTGNVWGGIIVTSFTSTVSVGAGLFLSHRVGTLTHSLYIECNSGATITDAIYVNVAGTLTNFIKFAATSGGVVSTSSGGGTRSYKITCAVGGVAAYMSLYTD